MLHEPKRDAVRKHKIQAADLKRIARALTHDAAVQINMAPNDPESVHIVRVQIKKMRALLRLIRPLLRKASFTRQNIALRDAGRKLSPHRDAQVVHATCQYLATRKSARSIRPWLLHLVEHVAYNALEDLTPEAVNDAVGTLNRSSGLVNRLSQEAVDEKVIREGLRKAYRSGRKALRCALLHTTTRHMHEFRKRVKCLLHQLDMVVPMQPGDSHCPHEHLRRLGNHLGHLHDLSIVRHRLGSTLFHDMEDHQLERVHSYMKARHRKLEHLSLHEGRAFYKDSPRKWLKNTIPLKPEHEETGACCGDESQS